MSSHGTGATALAEGTYVNGQYINPWDLSTCPRCGLQRRRNSRAARNTLCIDCRAIEQPRKELAAWTARNSGDLEPSGQPTRLPGGIVRWVIPPEPEPPMTADDWAWCRAQEKPHKRLQAERANRRGYWQQHDEREAG